MHTVHAIFENGVFRPVQPVRLPEQTEVEFEPRVVAKHAAGADGQSCTGPASGDALRGVYAILSERYASGHTDTAARHNEHQP